MFINSLARSGVCGSSSWIWVGLWLLQAIYFSFLFYLLAIPHSLWDLSSLTKDWTHTLSSESTVFLSHWTSRVFLWLLQPVENIAEITQYDLAWRIPGTGEPGGLPSMGSHRVRHNWSDLAAAAADLSEKVSTSYVVPAWSCCNAYSERIQCWKEVPLQGLPLLRPPQERGYR